MKREIQSILLLCLILGIVLVTILASCDFVKTSKDIWEDIQPEIREIIKKIIDNVLKEQKLERGILHKLEPPLVNYIEDVVYEELVSNHKDNILKLIESHRK